LIPTSNEEYEPAYTQVNEVLVHGYGSESNRSEQNSTVNRTSPAQNHSSHGESIHSTQSSSGEEMASYMLTDISSNISGIQITQQNEEHEIPGYAQVKYQPQNRGSNQVII